MAVLSSTCARCTVHVASWNVLADCYTSIQWSYREALLERILLGVVSQVRGVAGGVAGEDSTVVVMLQEVDNNHIQDFYRPLFTRLGLKVIFSKRPGKEDGCLIAYNEEHLGLQSVETVQFDDLADISLTSDNSHMYTRQTFLRHNIALLACFLCQKTGHQVTVANTHLYWNPNFPEVKAGQVKYLLDRICSFQRSCKFTPGSKILLGGDFNSTPTSEVYSLLTHPFASSILSYPICLKSSVTARRRYLLPSKYIKSPTDEFKEVITPSFICDDTLSKFCRWLRILGISCTMLKAADIDKDESAGGGISKMKKKIVDTTGNVSDDLSLGKVHISDEDKSTVNATPTERNNKQLLKAEKARKKLAQNNTYYSYMIDTAKKENRIILTTNKQWQQRADMLESFLVCYTDLESSMVALYRLYDLPLDESKFLTVCGKCGGRVITCDKSRFKVQQLDTCTQVTFPLQPLSDAGDSKSDIQSTNKDDFERNKSDGTSEKSPCDNGSSDIPWVPLDRELFCCEKCFQPYWTNDKATSSFGKALQTAHSLKDLIEAAERSTTEKEYEFESDQGGDSVDDMISNPLVTLTSCFCSSFGSEPDCTNWTEDFIGTLDYIFVTSDFDIIDTKVIGSIDSICEGESKISGDNNEGVSSALEFTSGDGIKGPYPCDSWPSDHLLICTTLRM